MTNENSYEAIQARLVDDYDPPKDYNRADGPPDMFRQAIEDVRWLSNVTILRDQIDDLMAQVSKLSAENARLRSRVEPSVAQDPRNAQLTAEQVAQGYSWPSNPPPEPEAGREAWLNGWHRRGALVFVSSFQCAGCGKHIATGAVALSSDDKVPERDPDWPFEEATCPVCHK